MKLNQNFKNIKESYLFAEVADRTGAYAKLNPDKKILKLGIGDVTLPLAPAVIEALHGAVEDMSKSETFRGYGPYEGYEFLRESIQGYYRARGVQLGLDEIFVSDGAKSDLGNILDIFSKDNVILVPDPVYPVYVDTNEMAGRKVLFSNATEENGFLPMPDYKVKADVNFPAENIAFGQTFEKLFVVVDNALNRSVAVHDTVVQYALRRIGVAFVAAGQSYVDLLAAYAAVGKA